MPPPKDQPPTRRQPPPCPPKRERNTLPPCWRTPPDHAPTTRICPPPRRTRCDPSLGGSMPLAPSLPVGLLHQRRFILLPPRGDGRVPLFRRRRSVTVPRIRIGKPHQLIRTWSRWNPPRKSRPTDELTSTSSWRNPSPHPLASQVSRSIVQRTKARALTSSQKGPEGNLAGARSKTMPTRFGAKPVSPPTRSLPLWGLGIAFGRPSPLTGTDAPSSRSSGSYQTVATRSGISWPTM